MLIDLCEQSGGWIHVLGTICMFTHDSTGRKAILTGWLALQSDMLLEDWYVVGEESDEYPLGVPRCVVHRGIAAYQIDRYTVELVDGETVVREISTGDYRSVSELKDYINDYRAETEGCTEEHTTEKPATAPKVPLGLAVKVAERIDDPEIDEIMKAGSIYEIATAPTLMSVKKSTLRRVICWMWHKIWKWEENDSAQR